MDAEHRIDFRLSQGAVEVTCTCLLPPGRKRYTKVIDGRRLFPLADAMSTWRDWHAKKGITV